MEVFNGVNVIIILHVHVYTCPCSTEKGLQHVYLSYMDMYMYILCVVHLNPMTMM